MSASTVSITANTSARRRPTAAAENTEPLITGTANNNSKAQVLDGGDNLRLSHSKGLSHHSLERHSKDLVRLKKGISNPTVSPRRIRKVVASKSDKKPLWLTVVRVFVKNFVLLLLLIGLVQIVRKSALKQGDFDLSKASSSAGFLEIEGRIADVESFLKKTTKMIQVQVEVIDKKINEEVEGLRKEVKDMVDKRHNVYDSQLQKLVATSEQLEKSVNELKATNRLSKEDFDRLYAEVLKKGKGNELGGSGVSLDEIRGYAREIVQSEIEKHAADGLGMVDYALSPAGGMVVKHSEALMIGKINKWLFHGVHPNANVMLKPSFGEPGLCFSLKGGNGFVQVKLRTAIVPQAITLEHVAKSVAFDRSSAPKDCRVTGWLQGSDIGSAIEPEKMLLLTEFTYDLEKSNAQTFDVLDSVATSSIIDTVRLDFTSNHGSPTHTCLYRFRVHGYEPRSVSSDR